jgi:hypothetical protein
LALVDLGSIPETGFEFGSVKSADANVCKTDIIGLA